MGVRFTEVSTANRQVLMSLIENLYKTKLDRTSNQG
jgi:hypothetical protein